MRLSNRAVRLLPPVRAGNILGGGDWGRDRLLPDAVRAFAERRTLLLRNPGATRPWQHVLDVLRGTLVLGERSAPSPSAEALAWNLGPSALKVHTVAEVAALGAKAWGDGAHWREEPDSSIRETHALVLSSEKARLALGWQCEWGVEKAVGEAIAWYRAAVEGKGDLLKRTFEQIDAHVADVKRAGA